MKKLFLGMTILALCAFSAFSQVNVELPKGPVELFDGFEKGNYWIWAGFDYDQYGPHKISNGANLSMDWASEGRHSLELTMEAMGPGSSKSASWFYDGTNDLSGTKYLAVDIYNPEDYTYNIYAVLQATNEWKWCQPPQSYQLGKGVHTVVYDFREFTSFLSDVRRISINCDNWMEYNKESHIYIDNIRLIK
ncbi:hypothetical protein DYE50_11290 [Treponema ruminis]|uniref:Uncharacterized protein n=1 Tax=Treponema ruminis TaxID=744515 RepID=A0A7W8G8Q8_9SPIR|nr:hypothetical protein [Treponema ruminis]MBB5225937.1 hypothetical protein [Treponema ruminis]QSI03151.1 hypothetical protein DYE50_11290 [Treponema ruminis]